MAEAIALEQDNLEQDQKRALAKDKKGGSSGGKVTDEAMEKLKQEAVLAAKRATLRFINSAFAATIVGLIVTFIIMSIQAVAGNYLGSKFIPPLSMIELFVWAFLFIILILAIVAVMSLFAFILGPLIDPTLIPKIVFKIVVDFFSL